MPRRSANSKRYKFILVQINNKVIYVSLDKDEKIQNPIQLQQISFMQNQQRSRGQTRQRTSSNLRKRRNNDNEENMTPKEEDKNNMNENSNFDLMFTDEENTEEWIQINDDFESEQEIDMFFL